MKKFILLFTLLGSFITYSQVYLKSTRTPSVIGVSIGSITVELMNYDNPVFYVLNHLTIGGTAVNNTDTTNTLPWVNESEGIIAYAIDFISGDTIATMSWLNTTSSQDLVWNNIQPSSTNFSCNGISNISFTTSQTDILELEFTDLNGTSTTSNVTNLINSNLCPGKYKVTFKSSTNSVTPIYYSTEFFIGSNSSSTVNNATFDISVYSSISEDSLCTATSTALINGTTGPYQYSWDNGIFTTVDSIENVCPGPHVLTVVDTQNDTLSDIFVVSDYFGSTVIPGIPIIIDTLVLDFQNCTIDYSQVIDSAEITAYEIIDSITIFIEGTFWQNGIEYIVSDTLVTSISSLSQNGYIIVSISMYCVVKSNQNKVFKLYSYIPTGSYASILEDKSPDSKINIFPNPATSSFIINSANWENLSVKIINSLGKTMKSSDINSNNHIMNVSDLPPGIYFVQLNVNNVISEVQKIIIE